ncbi:glycoside hydrolase family 43 protein [Paenibacillus soyae]|uniref:Glycoside hydrolase family 43 protein n=1 Tax=Paenibacillus soyae TaxID=2969249 RepID=A0A9X2MW87_9BACL|nr:glycoside hydrolase family 43 protein [Paenibacillus soyae]MCR2806986.1 glycoside hydrolase family 43 protein [Paenibacillus soyae]
MRKFNNPLPVQTDGLLRISADQRPSPYNPDPYVLKFNGEYYAYATSRNGVAVMHAKDMTSWTYLGYAYQEEGRSDYWAPAVFYDNGLFYLYVSSVPSGEDDAHYQFMRVAVSERPEGPFEYRKTLFDTFSIDAHVVRDADGGLVLFYSTNETYGIDSHRAGTVILADRLLDPFTPEGKPKLIVRPTLNEEIFAKNRFGDGRDWHTIEGAFHLRRGGRHYVMYSGNAFTSPYYYIGYSTAPHEEGRSITELAWTKFPDEDTYEPLLRQNDRVEGVGHNSVAKAPNNVDDWVVYHGREVEQTTEEQGGQGERRQMRMDPLLWNGNRMWVPGPTYDEKPAPGLPAFRDLFDRADSAEIGIGEGWTTAGGDWLVRDGELLQGSQTGIARAYVDASYPHALFELNVRWERSHMGGLYGAVMLYGDDRGMIEMLFDVGKRTIGLYETVRGIRMPALTAEVPRGFRFDAYHQLMIRAAGRTLRVELDGVEVLGGNIYAPVSRYGLAAHYTSARYDGIALTGTLSFLESGASAFARLASPVSGQWSAEGDRLSGLPAEGKAGIVIRNPFPAADSYCRFELTGSRPEVSLTLETPTGRTRGIAVPGGALSEGGTVHLRHEEGVLQIWAGSTLVLSEPAEGDFSALTVSSGGKLTIGALEWTALGS